MGKKRKKKGRKHMRPITVNRSVIEEQMQTFLSSIFNEDGTLKDRVAQTTMNWTLDFKNLCPSDIEKPILQFTTDAYYKMMALVDKASSEAAWKGFVRIQDVETVKPPKDVKVHYTCFTSESKEDGLSGIMLVYPDMTPDNKAYMVPLNKMKESAVLFDGMSNDELQQFVGKRMFSKSYGCSEVISIERKTPESDVSWTMKRYDKSTYSTSDTVTLQATKMEIAMEDNAAEFTEKDYDALQSLMASQLPAKSEFGFGVEYKPQVRKQRIYTIDDIAVYPQLATGATVESDDDKYNAWTRQLIREHGPARVNEIRMQGHSHVNMACVPSGTDLKYYSDELKDYDDYYIFMIVNKKREKFIRIHDFQLGMVFETADVIFRLIDSNGNSVDDWAAAELKEKLKQKTTDYSSYGSYGASGRSSGAGYGSGYGHYGSGYASHSSGFGRDDEDYWSKWYGRSTEKSHKKQKKSSYGDPIGTLYVVGKEGK